MMQDDFGEFLQAPLATSGANMRGFASSAATTKSKDLDSKIMESFDLSGSTQKASFRFQQPTKNVRKRPVNVQYKQSSSSANWQSLDLDSGEFMSPLTKTTMQQQSLPFPGQQMHFDGFIDPVDTKDATRYHQMQAASSTTCLGYGPQSTVPVTNQMSFPAQSSFQIQGGPHLMPILSGDNSTVQTMQPPGYIVRIQDGAQRLPSFASSILPGDRMLKVTDHKPQFQQTGVVSQSEVNFQNDPIPSLTTGPKILQKSAIHSPDFTLPPWMTKPGEIPALYKEVLKMCATANSFADTARLYPIFVSSKLPKDVLGHIWSAANRSSPGQLTFSEVYIALALIALAQRGEMNLTVSYVTKLNTAPIPSLQLPVQPMPQTYQVKHQTQSPMNSAPGLVAGSSVSTQVLSLLEPTQSLAPTRSIQCNLEDDFSDFQSVPPVTSSSRDASFNPNAAQEIEFDGFQSYAPASEINLMNSVCPDRSIINSPKAKDASAVSSECKVPAKPLLSNIDFSKLKPDPTKALYSAAKSLNVARPPATVSTFRTKENESGFGEFKTNTGKIQPLNNSQNNDFSTSVDASFMSRNKVPIVGNLPGMSDFSDFKAAPVLQSLQSSPSASSNNLTAGNSEQKRTILIDADEAVHDKYSALRDIEPIIRPNPEVLDSELEFTDFQSVSSFPQDNNDSATTVKDDLYAAEKAVGSVDPSFFGKIPYKEDSQSISSLELPSLSKTISSMSIGSSSPNKLAEDLCSSQDKPTAFGDFASFAPISTASTVPPSVSDNTYQMISRAADDGLYNLDEPISPLASRKFPDNASESHGNVTSPPGVKRFIVPRRISEADSDFGDFSSGPPPIDDLDDHHADFDVNQAGTSSLVDFDAFGHFEEAKEETRKKKEAMFNQKRSKKDATAFSEFVESSIKNMKQASDINDPSHPGSEEPELVEEGWSAFNGEDISNDHTVSNKFESGEISDICNEKLTVEFHVDSTEGFSSTWRLESTISEPEVESTEQTCRWDEEGEELKARMEGSSKQNTTELYVEHWGRCLATCKDIIVSTGDIFAALNSPAVCHEIVNSLRGKEFIACTSEVYGVARRIRKGMESVGVLDDDLHAAVKEIEIAWHNLLGFCPYTPSVHKTPEHCCSTPADTTHGVNNFIGTSACSLCLLSTSGSVPVGLEYGGKSYHAPCANLWLNQIAPILPRLELPV